MSGNSIGGVRRAQLITTYGVGALIAVESNSYMIAGIDRWPDAMDGNENVVHEPRLQQQLRVSGFRLPPSSQYDGRGDVPVIRFPVFHSCPESGTLKEHWKWGNHRGTAKCKVHDRELVPSRFVVCCTNGHIDDFPYFRWVHAGSPPGSASEHEMTIESAGRSAALRDIVIACSCGKRVSMEGALSRGALKGIARCTGRRPWLGSDQNQECNEVPRGMQRGASGVWFSEVRSAISIPPWSEAIHKLIEKHWKALGKTRHLRDTIEDMDLARGKSFGIDEIMKAVEQRRRIEAGLEDYANADLKAEEYEALIRTTPETARDQDFVCVPAENLEMDPALAVAQTMRVKRLREVRVLEAFTRIEPPSPADDRKRLASLYREDERPDWLPAIEVIGEGVFLRLDQERLAEWESRPEVTERVAPLDRGYRQRFWDRGTEPDRVITPRLVLIHTLAHAIINEWSLDSGYPAAALRERLYTSNSMAGLLIYTATSDSAGSLGGIVAQVESGDLDGSIRRAIERVSWCSADPLCIETQTSGVDNLNRAACHACVLLPETSCEEYNTLLDRALLTGLHENNSVGFFSWRAAIPSTGD
ncbi:hypothetical protein Pth03_11750 [Planotetraspora thailandica]|uniref:MrfA-like Zn-binding domain-containing protein n=1 Tax=Planotetraspora thailandica TaxID=487172 RepID=A0A8J3V0G6_9ACTN|nr:DUF1998 domain-containing protein [Planotetraspora thailandica]GII52786.1 hypothetical protein Pth03_11750 [Planotetraspora thailandica]